MVITSVKISALLIGAAVLGVSLLFAVPIQAADSINYQAAKLDSSGISSRGFRNESKPTGIFTAMSLPSTRMIAVSEMDAFSPSNQLFAVQLTQVATATLDAYPAPTPGIDAELVEPDLSDVELQSYPAPIEIPVDPQSYPQSESQPTSPAVQPFSPPSLEDDLGSIQEIGDDFEGSRVNQVESNQRTSSTLFLWLGFIVALTIFLAGVYGSIVLFTRQKSSGG